MNEFETHCKELKKKIPCKLNEVTVFSYFYVNEIRFTFLIYWHYLNKQIYC